MNPPPTITLKTTIHQQIPVVQLQFSELINMCSPDISSGKPTLSIREGKGRNDGMSFLRDLVGIILQRYLKTDKPNYWLFDGLLDNRDITRQVGFQES